MPKYTVNPIQYSSQDILNESYNPAFAVLQVAPVGYSSVSDTFQPLNSQIAWDAIVPTFNSTSDVYNYYQGGTGGILVSTVTINYTDSTKATISSIVRTNG